MADVLRANSQALLLANELEFDYAQQNTLGDPVPTSITLNVGRVPGMA